MVRGVEDFQAIGSRGERLAIAEIPDRIALKQGIGWIFNKTAQVA